MKEIIDDDPVFLHCISSVSMMIMFTVGTYICHLMFKKLLQSMELHQLCLLEFKESPMSKKVIKNLPKMDIIQEDNEDEGDEEELPRTRSQVTSDPLYLNHSIPITVNSDAEIAYDNKNKSHNAII